MSFSFRFKCKKNQEKKPIYILYWMYISSYIYIYNIYYVHQTPIVQVNRFTIAATYFLIISYL